MRREPSVFEKLFSLTAFGTLFLIGARDYAYKLTRRAPKLIGINENKIFKVRIRPSLCILPTYTIALVYREPILHIPLCP